MGTKSKNSSIGKVFAEVWLAVTGQLFDGYHPERHYMRGPGPKWHAKHATVRVAPPRLHGAAKVSA